MARFHERNGTPPEKLPVPIYSTSAGLISGCSGCFNDNILAIGICTLTCADKSNDALCRRRSAFSGESPVYDISNIRANKTMEQQMDLMTIEQANRKLIEWLTSNPDEVKAQKSALDYYGQYFSPDNLKNVTVRDSKIFFCSKTTSIGQEFTDSPKFIKI
jgi:hypothetical protein